MSMTTPSRDARYMTVAILAGGTPPAFPQRPTAGPGGFPDASPGWLASLRVQLDDELFLDLGVDLGAGGQPVHQDPHLVRDDLQPGWRRHAPLRELGPGYHERGHLD